MFILTQNILYVKPLDHSKIDLQTTLTLNIITLLATDHHGHCMTAPRAQVGYVIYQKYMHQFCF